MDCMDFGIPHPYQEYIPSWYSRKKPDEELYILPRAKPRKGHGKITTATERPELVIEA